MTQDNQPTGQDAGGGRPGGPLTVTQERGTGRFFLLVPAVAFVVGLVLGGVVVAITGIGDTTRQPAVAGSTASPTGSPSASSPATSGTSPTSSDATVTIPGQCLQLTNNSQQLLDLVGQAATAARDLDAAKLSAVVSRLQQVQQQLKQQTDACRSAAAGGS